MEDMATLAVNPGVLERVPAQGLAQRIAQGSAHFHELEDSAIMLELRAGNMAGFDFLIHKYRKPIINFMYRMVHNQAVAEELAQEVFLRVYRSRETWVTALRPASAHGSTALPPTSASTMPATPVTNAPHPPSISTRPTPRPAPLPTSRT